MALITGTVFGKSAALKLAEMGANIFLLTKDKARI